MQENKLILICLLLSLSGVILGLMLPEILRINNQKEYQLDWDRTYGGVKSDSASDILHTKEGDFLIVGGTTSNGTGNSDMWVVKTDNRGTIQWNRTYGGLEIDYAETIIQTSDGTFAILGNTRSYGAGWSDLWLVKIDNQGRMLWNKTYGSSDNEYATGLLQTPDGGFLLAGNKHYSLGGINLWVVKTDSNGNVQWNQTYGGNSPDYFSYSQQSLIQTLDGGYALLGNTESFGSMSTNIWLIKIDQEGVVQWTQIYGNSEVTTAGTLLQTETGCYVFVGGRASESTRDLNLWLMKTDTNGTMLWNHTYTVRKENSTFEVSSHSLIQTSDGGFFMASRSRYDPGSSDLWVVKTDSTGVLQWNQTYGGSDHEYMGGILQLSDNSIVLAGATMSYGMGERDIWLLR
ncbi:MAG: hypothetical protein ACW98I_21325, partial [Candidatus Hodarchaeales archaeon]